jgi:hypothetical protein
MRTTLLLSSLPLVFAASACGHHLGVDLDAVRATRQSDNRVSVEAEVSVGVTGDPVEAGKVKEVCAIATWSEQPIDFIDEETITPLFTAKSCTTESWTNDETKVLTMTTAEAIPTDKPMIITVELTVSAPDAELSVIVNDDFEDQIANP